MGAEDLLDAERERIELLLERDGREATRRWVERTLEIYEDAVDNPHSHGSAPTYRPLFERSIREFREWLEQSG